MCVGRAACCMVALFVEDPNKQQVKHSVCNVVYARLYHEGSIPGDDAAYQQLRFEPVQDLLAAYENGAWMVNVVALQRRIHEFAKCGSILEYFDRRNSNNEWLHIEDGKSDVAFSV
jgi:hypothetical protein